MSSNKSRLRNIMEALNEAKQEKTKSGESESMY